MTSGNRPLAAICLFVVCLGLWNAARYPTGGGFDAPSHMSYADNLFPGWHLPHPSATEATEYYTPPGFYFVAGVADWLLKQTTYGDPGHEVEPRRGVVLRRHGGRGMREVKAREEPVGIRHVRGSVEPRPGRVAGGVPQPQADDEDADRGERPPSFSQTASSHRSRPCRCRRRAQVASAAGS